MYSGSYHLVSTQGLSSCNYLFCLVSSMFTFALFLSLLSLLSIPCSSCTALLPFTEKYHKRDYQYLSILSDFSLTLYPNTHTLFFLSSSVLGIRPTTPTKTSLQRSPETSILLKSFLQQHLT